MENNDKPKKMVYIYTFKGDKLEITSGNLMTSCKSFVSFSKVHSVCLKVLILLIPPLSYARVLLYFFFCFLKKPCCGFFCFFPIEQGINDKGGIFFRIRWPFDSCKEPSLKLILCHLLGQEFCCRWIEILFVKNGMLKCHRVRRLCFHVGGVKPGFWKKREKSSRSYVHRVPFGCIEPGVCFPGSTLEGDSKLLLKAMVLLLEVSLVIEKWALFCVYRYPIDSEKYGGSFSNNK
ncbi:uncharacterized protein [Coffea arabica]|uniref:Uncharacterized protein isoform X3 n=1 Tax=Coffea arabica TaxID=13443 RepID=A0ABM4W6S5_COFAR